MRTQIGGAVGHGGFMGHLVWISLLGGLLAVMLPTMANADTTISRSYTSDGKLPLGAIVSLESGANDPDHVVLAAPSNVDNMLGIVISNENSALAISSGKGNQVQVATNGVAQVLVSDINGNVAKGDHITASPLAGVGMKATGNVRIVGVAQTDLKDGKKQSYKDSAGKEQSVNVGAVPVIVNVAYYFKEPDKSLIPSAIQNLANALAGKTVSSLPILVSAGIFVVMLIVVSSIIYSMIRGSIISVGRNPMSQAAIYRGIIQLSVLIVVILGVGLSSIYLVLTRVG